MHGVAPHLPPRGWGEGGKGGKRAGNSGGSQHDLAGEVLRGQRPRKGQRETKKGWLGLREGVLRVVVGGNRKD